VSEPLHIISLGAGVQSSTMALMAAHGEITPMPGAAIFADTGNEPESVYGWLNWLEGELPFPVYRVSRDGASLADTSVEIRKSEAGNFYTKSAVPAFIIDSDGKKGLLMRQCSVDFKIIIVRREIRRILLESGIKSAVQWLGISLDEAHRMKPSEKLYIENCWPLIDLRMSRQDCLNWMETKGYPQPPRSSCVFCPYHSNFEWKRLKEQEPDSFKYAVRYESRLQKAMRQVTGFRGVPFLHRSCEPLGQIDFDEPGGQQNLFGNECEGVCGV
jgi:hypothetical protein